MLLFSSKPEVLDSCCYNSRQTAAIYLCQLGPLKPKMGYAAVGREQENCFAPKHMTRRQTLALCCMYLGKWGVQCRAGPPLEALQRFEPQELWSMHFYGPPCWKVMIRCVFVSGPSRCPLRVLSFRSACTDLQNPDPILYPNTGAQQFVVP